MHCSKCMMDYLTNFSLKELEIYLKKKSNKIIKLQFTIIMNTSRQHGWAKVC